MLKTVPTTMVDIILRVSVLVLYFLPIAVSSPCLHKLHLPDFGPQSSAFDSKGKGPYTGLADGRILKYEAHIHKFVEFAYTHPKRTAKFCDGTNDTYLAGICGRPLGLAFYHKTGELYITDAARGLLVVGPKGGLAKQLVNKVHGVRLRSPDALDVDQRTGNVYFTEASAMYNLSEIPQLMASKDASGRVFKYNPRNKKVTVLVKGIAGAAGLAVSKDGSYLLIAESMKARIHKHWLKGPSARTTQICLNVTGGPDRIKRNQAGDFWISLTVPTKKPKPGVILQGQKINGNGDILQTVTFSPLFNSTLITEVQEFNGAFYLGSFDCDYVAVNKCPH